ncbi:hypothetical protein ACR6C2_29190 [Streptomyces sp. INA 01156]
MYAQAADGEVKVAETEGGGTVELRVVSGKQKLSVVQDRAWAKKAEREFDPTAEQLRAAGIPVEDGQVTLSDLEEVLVLDATSYRIESHRLEFGFLIPYNGQDITFEQKVSEANQGPYRGRSSFRRTCADAEFPARTRVVGGRVRALRGQGRGRH